MPQASVQSLEAVASRVGSVIEKHEHGGWVREIGEKGWLRRSQLYNRLYRRVRKEQTNEIGIEV